VLPKIAALGPQTFVQGRLALLPHDDLVLACHLGLQRAQHEAQLLRVQRVDVLGGDHYPTEDLVNESHAPKWGKFQNQVTRDKEYIALRRSELVAGKLNALPAR